MASDWDRINEIGPRSPVLHSIFIGAALAEFGKGTESLVRLRDNGIADAAAVVQARGPFIQGLFQPSQLPVGPVVLSARDSTAPLARRLLAVSPATTALFEVTQQDPDLAVRPVSDSCIRCLDYVRTARVSLVGDFDSYWKSRGKNLRHNMRRQSNRLRREAVDVRFEVLMQPGQMKDAVASYAELETSGWKASKGTAVVLESAQGRFYTRVLREFAERERAFVFRLWYADRIVAVDLCIESFGTVVVLKTTYDESQTTTSPALLLRRAYLEKLFELGDVERVEFYGRVMDWHTKWTDEVRTMYHINVYRSGLFANIHSSLRYGPGFLRWGRQHLR